MAAETDTGLRSSPWLFLLGAVVFLGSIALFVYDLRNGDAVARGLAVNGLAAALVLALAGRETLANPDSQIRTGREALRAIMFFYGIYLLVAGVVVLVTAALSHPALWLGGGYVGAGATVAIVIFLTGGTEGLPGRLSTLIGLGGLVLVVVSVVLFAYDLATGGDVLRGIAVNGLGAALFILWTAYDMPADPESGVETHTDALGVALLFYGAYLLVAGAVVALTALLAHGRGSVGLLYLALGGVTLIFGFLLAPVDALEGGSGETGDDGAAGEPTDDEPADRKP